MWNPAFWCLVAVSLSAFGLGFLALLSPAVKRAVQVADPGAEADRALCHGPPLGLACRTAAQMDVHPPWDRGAGGRRVSSHGAGIWISALWAIGFIPGVRPAQGLVCHGAYGVVRHPIYVGNTLSVLGMAYVPRSGAVVYVLVLVAIFLAGIPIEERDLRTAYGDEYSAYEKKVRYRLIPGVFLDVTSRWTSRPGGIQQSSRATLSRACGHRKG